MKFTLGIKPNVITGDGTTFDALSKIDELLIGRSCCFTSFGYAYGDSENVYGYNIEVYKRGKHRTYKHYVIYLYAFPNVVFKLLNVEINQGSRTFKIKPKKN